MADERDTEKFSQSTGQENEKNQPTMNEQESSNSQPIGGIDSNTGTGTTTSQGFTGAGGTGTAGASGQGSGLDEQSNTKTDSETLTADRQDTESKDEGFIGSQANDSEDLVRKDTETSELDSNDDSSDTDNQ